MKTNKKTDLEMTFDLNVVEHLGSKMYPTIPAAISELIANSYDACSSTVQIKFFVENNSNQSIEIIDEGIGMSFDEINERFLLIGRNRREKSKTNSFKNITRVVTGKKGLGKLALFGIGERIDVETARFKEKEQIKFSLIWEELKNWNKEKQNHNYKPQYEKFEKNNKNVSGTKIVISSLKRKKIIDQKYIEDLAISLSKMFTFFDENFKVTISLNNGKETLITTKLWEKDIKKQFEWEFPENSETIGYEYAKKHKITGKIFTTIKPLPSIKQRGIALFANGRLVNARKFYGNIESSHFFSYAAGYLNVDFIDNDEEDLISTDRHSINWKNDKTLELKEFLEKIANKIHKSWREKRKQENIRQIQSNSNIKVEKWLPTLPQDKATNIKNTIQKLSSPDRNDNSLTIYVESVHKIAPEYAEWHWKYFHKKINSNDFVYKLYKDRHYLQAMQEAIKLYIKEIRDITKITSKEIESEMNLMAKVFGDFNKKMKQNQKIFLTNRLDKNEEEIEKGQRFLSMGLIAAFRNPTAHETQTNLMKEKKILENKDFLDILNLISYFFRKLESRKNPN